MGILAVCDSLPKGTVRASAHVAARWGTERALVTLTSGAVFELPAPEHLRGKFEVGDPVAIYVGPDGDPRGWILQRIGRGAVLPHAAGSLGVEPPQPARRELCEGVVVSCDPERGEAVLLLDGRSEGERADVPRLLGPRLRPGARVIARVVGGRVADWTVTD